MKSEGRGRLGRFFSRGFYTVFALVLWSFGSTAWSQTITASGSPCAVPVGAFHCTVTISWTSSVPVKVYVRRPNTTSESLMSSTSGSGSTAVSWISYWPGQDFVLRRSSDNALLGVVNSVYGRRATAAADRGGSNYSWYHVDNGPGTCPTSGGTSCGDFWPYSLLRFYHNPGVRTTVQAKLASMYAGGQRRLRQIIFHCRSCGGAASSAEDSTFTAGNYLPAQFRLNLATFLTDVKAAGFQHYYASMGPSWLNDIPASCSTMTAAQINSYKTENFGVIGEVRAILVAANLPYTIDLANEWMPHPGAAPCSAPYLQSLWTMYHTAYGTNDTSGFSTIVNGTWDVNNRLASAASVYGSVLPRYIDVHMYKDPYDTPQTTLRKIADKLYQMWPTEAEGLRIVIGETDYQSVGAAHADSLREGARDIGSVQALYQWTSWRDPVDGYSHNVLPDSFTVYSSRGF